ncbi:glycosyltransferase family 4 protein [Yersinia enterocolitica]
MSNSNVAFFIGDSSAKGGTERVTIALANALSKSINTDIVSLEKTSKPYYKIENRVNLHYINEGSKRTFYGNKINFITRLVSDLVYLIKSIPKVRLYLKNSLASHIVSTDTKMALLLLLSSIGLKTKVIAMEHFDYRTPSFLIRIIRIIIYRYVNAIVILTHEDEAFYSKINKNIFIIPNMVSVSSEQQPNFKNKRIVSIGRLTEQKGFDLLIEAWEKIENTLKDWRLDIIGEGHLHDELDLMINNKQLKNVHLIGFSDDIKSEYLDSSFLVMSSRYEGLGMVLIEALACGLPCISFNCPSGPSTIITNSVNGYLVNSLDPDDLASKILELATDFNKLSALASNAKESIRQYQEEEVIKKWSVLFDS